MIAAVRVGQLDLEDFVLMVGVLSSPLWVAWLTTLGRRIRSERRLQRRFGAIPCEEIWRIRG